MASRRSSTDELLLRVRAFGLAYPGAHTKSPWPGHLDLAVKDKTFAYLGLEGEPFKISCKLPRSADHALMLPHTQPTGYGLGKSGWVSMSLPPGATVPADLLEAWIDESYRAQAPKRLVAELDARAGGPARAPVAKTPAAKTPAAKTPAAKKPAAKTLAPTKKAAPKKPAPTKEAAARSATTKTTPKKASASRR